jgi:hypothetical protein
MRAFKKIDGRHPDLLPLLVLGLLGIGFFFPVLFLGYAPAINDLRQVEPWREEWVKRGDATVEHLPNGAPVYHYKNSEAFADDLNRQFIPWGLYAQERLRSGHLPLWNPHLACGQPLFANHQTGLTNPLIVLCYYIFPGISAFTAIFLSVFILMGWGMYAYLRMLGLARGPSLLAAATYQFMLGYIPTLDTLVVEKAMFPFLLYCVERSFRSQAGRGWPWVIGSILLLALVQTSAHAQEAVFILYLLGPYIVFVAGGRDAFPRGSVLKNILKRVVFAVGIYVPATLLGMIQNLPTYEFYNLSTRAANFQEQIQTATFLESNLTWIQSLMIAFPRLFGDYLKPEHFLEHYLLNYGYVGIVTLLAGLFAGWIRSNRRQVWFWRIVALVFFISVISNWFYFSVLCYLPLFRISLQKPYSPLFFSLIVLGAHGFAYMLDPKPAGSSAAKVLGRTSLVVYGAGIALLALWLVHLALPNSPDVSDRRWVFSQLLTGSLVLSAACLVVSLMWGRANKSGERASAVSIGTILLFAVILLDLWPVKAHFNPFARMSDLFFRTPPTDLLESSLAWEPGRADGPYRFGRSWREVLPPNTGMIYGLDDFGGYDSNLVERYGVLMNGVDKTILEGAHYIEAPRRRDTFASKVWDMIGVKYVGGHPGHTGQYLPPEKWELVYSQDMILVRNLDALPRMHLVEKIITTTDDATELSRTLRIDPVVEAVVGDGRESPFASQPDASGTRQDLGSVTITSYEPEEVRAAVVLNRPALLCFYDVNFPGWEVLVDGAPADLERVNYTFKGVFVAQGEHEVKFRYRPDSLRQGEMLSLAGLILCLLIAWPLAVLVLSKRTSASG